MPHDRWPVAAYLQIRKSRWLLAIMVSIGVIVWAWGAFETSVPAANVAGGAKIQFWRLLAVGSACLPVLTLESSMEALEAAGGSHYQRLRSAVLGGAFLVSSACILVAAAVGIGLAVTPLIARALVAWFGLALISGRLLGWNYSWILPWAALCALLYWGHSSGAGDYRWWEFSAQPAAHLPSLMLALTLFAIGLVAYWMSPWRVYSVGRALRRSGRPRVDLEVS